MSIDLKQDSYRRFRDIVAERTRPVVLWVGAGLSVSAGVPAWSGLRKSVEAALARKAQNFIGEEGKKLNNTLNQIQKVQDLWVAFERLKGALGETSFTHAIKEGLANADSKIIPPVYELLWQLPVRGIVSLNLDRFAARAYPKNLHYPEPFQILGYKSAHSTSNPFRQNKPFVINLHGSLDHHESWVLTANDLSLLAKKAHYRTFVETCFNGFTVLFLGITADDIAVGGHIERLRGLGVDTGAHFWVTS